MWSRDQEGGEHRRSCRKLLLMNNDLLLQLIIVAVAGACCFGCGALTAFIVTRKQWRGEMIRRGAARYNSQTGKWEWGESPTRGGSR